MPQSEENILRKFDRKVTFQVSLSYQSQQLESISMETSLDDFLESTTSWFTWV